MSRPMPEVQDIDTDEKQDLELHVARSRCRAEDWENDQTRRMGRPDFRSSTHEARGGSQALAYKRSKSNNFTNLFRSQSCKLQNDALEPGALKRLDLKQPSIKKAIKRKSFRSKLKKAIYQFFLYGGLSAHAVTNNPFYQTMFDEAARAGPGATAPTAYELMGPLLKEEKRQIDMSIEDLSKKWPQYEVTIMCDGWTGPTRKSIINFIVYCDGMTIFHSSVNASNVEKNWRTIYGLMKTVVDKVGKKNVVQIVTDNGSAYLKADTQLMKTPGYNLFWTLCVCHCIDLMLREIGNSKKVKALVEEARSITTFIDNHNLILDMMRTKCNGDIVRPGITRFASNFITPSSLLDKMESLRSMFTSPEWLQYKRTLKNSSIAIRVEDLVGDKKFWKIWF